MKTYTVKDAYNIMIASLFEGQSPRRTISLEEAATVLQSKAALEGNKISVPLQIIARNANHAKHL